MLQIAGGVKLLVKVGVGFTTTTTLYVVGFVQPFAVTVYTYVTLTGKAVVLVNISPGSPLPLPARLLIPATAPLLHAKLAPAVLEVGV